MEKHRRIIEATDVNITQIKEDAICAPVTKARIQILTQNISYLSLLTEGDRGGTVVKVLCYKSEGRYFDPSWC